MRFFSYLLYTLSFFALISSAHAARHNKLTDSNVRDFVEEATALTSGLSDSSIDETVYFLDTHLHKKARFKSVISYVLPGFPPQETALSFKKKDYIENIQNSISTIEDHESVVEIQSIQITSDGKQAVVITSGKETGMMQVPLPDNTFESVPMEGFTDCNQIIRLSRQGIIQMYNAVCNTTIQFISEF